MAEQNVAEAPAQFAADDFDGGNDFGGFEGEAEGAGQPGPGMGQSKSSRRRRRKRKNKAVAASGSAPAEGTSSPGAEEGTGTLPFVMEGESLAMAAGAQPQVRRPSSPQGSNGQQPQQGQGQSGKRWKKKFRDRERRQRSDTPGNDVRSDSGSNSGYSSGNGGYGGDSGYRSGGGRPDNFGNLVNGFKRKGKSGAGQGQQRKERGFVGPMDHSYREAEGNHAPPSTIQVHAGHGRRGHRQHHGDNQPIDRSMPPAPVIPENAQTHIYFFVEDLFITAKVQETARKQGIKVAFLKNDKDAIAELTSGEEINRPALIVFDLNNANAKPLTLIPKLKAKLKRSASIIGFLSTIQGDLKAKATEAGCDTVMPRAAFSQNLPNLLRRYGIEETEEVNYNF
jgi:hypothetical protein